MSTDQASTPDPPEQPTTDVEFVDGRLRLTTGLLAPRATGSATDSQRTVGLVAARALLLGGDRLRLRIHVGAGMTLVLTDVGATVAYAGRGMTANIDVTIHVGAAGLLVWDAQPLVVATGARVERRLDATVAAGGRMLLRDQIVLGREGEEGGDLSCRTRIRYDQRAALAEDLSLSPRSSSWMEGAGVRGDARVLDTILAIGWRPAPSRRSEQFTAFALDQPGAVLRDLAAETHLSALPSAWDSLLGEVAIEDDATDPSRDTYGAAVVTV